MMLQCANLCKFLFIMCAITSMNDVRRLSRLNFPRERRLDKHADCPYNAASFERVAV